MYTDLRDLILPIITRIKINAKIEYKQVFTEGYSLRDRLICLGSGTKKTPFITVRLVLLTS